MSAQEMAERYWSVATSDGPEAQFDSAEYVSARAALVAAVRAEFTMTAGQAHRVYELVTEYGPDDSLTWGIPGAAGRLHGIASYAARVRIDLAEQRAERKRVAASQLASERRQAYYDACETDALGLAGLLRYGPWDAPMVRMVRNLAVRRNLLPAS
jgi:hypothetical protein